MVECLEYPLCGFSSGPAAVLVRWSSARFYRATGHKRYLMSTYPAHDVGFNTREGC